MLPQVTCSSPSSSLGFLPCLVHRKPAVKHSVRPAFQQRRQLGSRNRNEKNRTGEEKQQGASSAPCSRKPRQLTRCYKGAVSQDGVKVHPSRWAPLTASWTALRWVQAFLPFPSQIDHQGKARHGEGRSSSVILAPATQPPSQGGSPFRALPGKKAHFPGELSSPT